MGVTYYHFGVCDCCSTVCRLVVFKNEGKRKSPRKNGGRALSDSIADISSCSGGYIGDWFFLALKIRLRQRDELKTDLQEAGIGMNLLLGL